MTESYVPVWAMNAEGHIFLDGKLVGKATVEDVGAAYVHAKQQVRLCDVKVSASREMRIEDEERYHAPDQISVAHSYWPIDLEEWEAANAAHEVQGEFVRVGTGCPGCGHAFIFQGGVGEHTHSTSDLPTDIPLQDLYVRSTA